MKIYFTVTGMNHYYGSSFVKPGMFVKLVKDPENEIDKEAIRVEMPGLGKIGYVANSIQTIIGNSFSAGRIYDKIEDITFGSVLYNTQLGLLCLIDTEKEFIFQFGGEDEDKYPISVVSERTSEEDEKNEKNEQNEQIKDI